jgi:hypothetical protein
MAGGQWQIVMLRRGGEKAVNDARPRRIGRPQRLTFGYRLFAD